MNRNAMAMIVVLGFGGTIAWVAGAQEPSPPRVQRCRIFPVADIDKDREFVTSDKTGEIGQWVAAREGEGWQIDSVDIEFGLKPTGYPTAWQQICVSK